MIQQTKSQRIWSNKLNLKEWSNKLNLTEYIQQTKSQRIDLKN